MTVYFVGPLPPPVHGFSAINAAMLAMLQARSNVEIFDRAHQGSARGPRLLAALTSLGHWAQLVTRFATSIATAKSASDGVYMGLSGGMGQWLDLPFVLFARLRGVPIHVHHHSFAYINQPSRLTRLALAVMGNAAQHIVLCDAMGSLLQERYHLQPDSVHTLSNIAFMQPGSAHPGEQISSNKTLTLGYLSNITEAKGIFEFFSAVAACQKNGIKVRGIVAGPVAAELRQRFESALSACNGSVKHLGAVYGKDKASFYAKLDLMLFPTKYENEAEPVTILEALQAGVPVVAAARGCIAGMLAGPWAQQNCRCPSIADFDDAAVAAAKQLLQRSSADLKISRSELVLQFNRQREDALKKLEQLLQAITRLEPVRN